MGLVEAARFRRLAEKETEITRLVRQLETTYSDGVWISSEYVGAICRIQDWGEYLDSISDLLVAPPRRAPGFSIPVVTEGNA